MVVMIESLIGILLFTILIVPLTLKNFISVGDYPNGHTGEVYRIRLD